MRARRILLFGIALSAVIVVGRWMSHRDRVVSEPSREAPSVWIRTVSAEAPPALPGPGVGRPLQTGDSIPDAHLVDQDGVAFRLSDLRGTNLVLAFLYTHCNLPSKCPLVARRLLETYEQVRRRKMEDVRFLAVSFDTERDHPERLQEYASRYGLDAPGITFATGTAGEVERLSAGLKTFFRPTGRGTFDHNIVISLVDRNGILRDEFFGNRWTSEDLVAGINRLVRAEGP
jgi:protein SCO1